MTEVRRRTGASGNGLGSQSLGGKTGRRKPGLGLSKNSGRLVQSRARNCSEHDLRDSGATRHRTGAGASRKTTWKEFLSRHWELIVAADFFSVEVSTRRGLQRFMVLIFIDLATRRVEIAGIASAVNGLWMARLAEIVRMPWTEF
jgi:hypothetical protein